MSGFSGRHGLCGVCCVGARAARGGAGVVHALVQCRRAASTARAEYEYELVVLVEPVHVQPEAEYRIADEPGVGGAQFSISKSISEPSENPGPL